MAEVVQAFTEEEEERVRRRLENLARTLRSVPGGGRMKEDYWSHIYHKVRGTEPTGWSNLPMRDYAHAGLGVEIKTKKAPSPVEAQGNRIMHPAATRTIAFDTDDPAEECKRAILNQFGDQIAEFRRRVAVNAGIPEEEADVRWGVFLYNDAFTEFLYFEEVMEEPNPDEFYAEFRERRSRGGVTKNLWIYEAATDVKRYSVTSPEKGAKVQPYFDVPYTEDGAHLFVIPTDDKEPLWLPTDLAERLDEVMANCDVTLEEVIQAAIERFED